MKKPKKEPVLSFFLITAKAEVYGPYPDILDALPPLRKLGNKAACIRSDGALMAGHAPTVREVERKGEVPWEKLKKYTHSARGEDPPENGDADPDLF